MQRRRFCDHRSSMAADVRYELWRQDDNGIRVKIDVYLTEAQAETARATFEAGAHKQMYWVEAVAIAR